MPRPSKRDQILQAAQRCFANGGITATGVDAIADAADVSKRTLYNHFPSKDDLVLHYIEWREHRWRERLSQQLNETADPEDRILVYFDSYFDTPEGEEFRGCAFINAAAEIADEGSPVLEAIVQGKERVRSDVEGLLVEAGHPAPSETATAVTALLEGGCTIAGIRRTKEDLDVLKRSALLLVHGRS